VVVCGVVFVVCCGVVRVVVYLCVCDIFRPFLNTVVARLRPQIKLFSQRACACVRLLIRGDLSHPAGDLVRLKPDICRL